MWTPVTASTFSRTTVSGGPQKKTQNSVLSSDQINLGVFWGVFLWTPLTASNFFGPLFPGVHKKTPQNSGGFFCGPLETKVRCSGGFFCGPPCRTAFLPFGLSAKSGKLSTPLDRVEMVRFLGRPAKSGHCLAYRQTAAQEMVSK